MHNSYGNSAALKNLQRVDPSALNPNSVRKLVGDQYN